MLKTAKRSAAAPPAIGAARVGGAAVAHLEPAAQRGSASALPDANVRQRTLNAEATGQFWLWTLISLPLFGLAILLLLTSVWTPPAVSSGDRLLDRLFSDFDRRGSLPWTSEGLTSLASRVNPSAYGEQQAVPRPATSGSILSRIDREFAVDPRYCLLLPAFGEVRVPAEADKALTARGLGGHAWFYEQARRQGAVNPQLMAELAYRYESSWKSQANLADANAAAPVDKRVDHWPAEMWQRRERYFREAAGSAFEPFINDLLQTAPDEAVKHYAAARLLCSAGYYDRARAELAKGNACPDSSGFACRLSSSIWQTAAPPAGTGSVEQMAFGPYFSRMYTDFIGWKDMVKKLAMDAAQRNDRAALQEVHTFACRFAQSGKPSTIQNLVGLVMVGVPGSALKEFGVERLTPAEWSALTQLRTCTDKIKTDYRQQQHLFEVMSPLQSLISDSNFAGKMKWQFMQTAGGPDYGAALWLGMGMRTERLESGYFEQVIKPMWQDIEAFDYRRMADFAKQPATTVLTATGD